MITNEWPIPEHPEWAPFLVQQVQSLRQAGVEVEVFSFRGCRNIANYLKAWLKVRWQYRTEHFDLIHAQFGQSGLVALPSHIPIVVTFHGSDLQGIVGPDNRYTLAGLLLRRLSQIVATYAKEVIIVSEHLTQYLPSNRAVQIIPCGIDFDLFKPLPQSRAREQLCLPPDKCLVLFAADPGRLVKRYHLAEAAIQHLKSQFDVELITLSGVPHAHVPLYMSACDALVLTSKHEGSPTVIKEALACNLPVVSVDVGDVRQRLAGVTGCVLCGDEFPETIASGLAQVLQVRRRIRGRDAIADLDERVVAQRIIRVYHSALSRG